MNSVSTATNGICGQAVDERGELVAVGDQRMNFHVGRGHSGACGLTKGEWTGNRRANASSTRTVSCTPIAPILAPQLRASDVGSTVRLSGWIHRKRDHGGVLFVDLRDHYGLTQLVCRAGTRGAEDARFAARRIGRHDRRRGRRARGRGGQRQARDRRYRGRGRQRSRSSRRAAELPMPVAGEADYPEEIRLKYRYLDLAPRAAARQHHAPLEGHLLDPPADDRAGLHRVPDPDPDRVEPRRRARLSGAEPGPSGQILRASAGAADVQAIADGRRLRPLFPDRALLPRRGCPRRPQPGRILPARLRDELRHAGRRVRRDRAGAGRAVRGVRERPQASPRRASSRASPTRKRC